MLLTGPFAMFVYAFIWFSFAIVYGRLPHPPLPTMAIATLAIATVFPLWQYFPVYVNSRVRKYTQKGVLPHAVIH